MKAKTLRSRTGRGLADRRFAAFRRRCLPFVAFVILFAATPSNVVAQPGSQFFAQAPARPIPRGWIVAGAGVVLLAGCGLLYASIRAWRSSNLFDREYHFPPAGAAAMRFGGTRCGGLMVTINFGESEESERKM